MSFPTQDGLETFGLDAGTDRPDDGRRALLQLVIKLRELILSRGQAEGICELDAEGKVPDGRIDKGVAGGLCELNEQGKVPATRLRQVRAGDGLVQQPDDSFEHSNSSDAHINAPPGHALTRLELDEFGHITLASFSPLIRAVRWGGPHDFHCVTRQLGQKESGGGGGGGGRGKDFTNGGGGGGVGGGRGKDFTNGGGGGGRTVTTCTLTAPAPLQVLLGETWVTVSHTEI